MPDGLSEACKEKLRQIERGLLRVVSTGSSRACFELLDDIVIATQEADNDCRELLRTIERELQNAIEKYHVDDDLVDHSLPEQFLAEIRKVQSSVYRYSLRKAV